MQFQPSPSRMELGERLTDAVRVEEYSHSPGLAGARVCRSSVQDVETRTRVGTLDDAPLRAVPVLDQCEAICDFKSHGPDVVCRDAGDSSQEGVAHGVRTGDDAPLRAVPLLDQRLKNPIGNSDISHCPDIAGGDSRNSIQDVI